MTTFVINLARDTERMAVKAARLDALGVAFTRVEAVEGAALSDDVKRASVNRFRWFCSRGYPVTDGEIGCALSHQSIYGRMIDENLPVACILEDDAPLDDRFAEQLARVARFIDPARPQVVLLSNYSVQPRDDWSIVPAAWDFSTEGYVITRPAARAILADNFPIKAPSDNWRRWVITQGLELYHAFPSVCLPAEQRFGSATETPYLIDRMSFLHKVVHKLFRIIPRLCDEALMRLGR